MGDYTIGEIDMLHDNGQKLINSLEGLGISFTWNESKESPGSPEIYPETEKDHLAVVKFLTDEAKKDQHAYSLMMGSGAILAKCLAGDCEHVQLVHTFNETDLEHIAKCIIDGYDQGQLVQETEDEEDV